MEKWCRNCHRSFDEVGPTVESGATFSVCSQCRPLKTHLNQSEQNPEWARSFDALYHLYLQMASSGNLLTAGEVLEKAQKLGLSTLDFLIGIVQPALYEIGKAWESGKLSIAEEHKVTTFCERIFHLAHTQILRTIPSLQTTRPTVLLVNAPENYHVLGIRIAELWLLSKGISCFTVYPGIPIPDTIELVRFLNPAVFGISIATESHEDSLHELENRLQKEPQPPIIVAGGYAVQSGILKAEAFSYITLVSDLNSLSEIVQKTTSIKKAKLKRVG